MLDRDELARALSDGRWWDAADMIARLRAATVAPVADAAPTDPRRTVGAVVTWVGFTFIVVKPGNGPDVMRDLFIPGDPLCPTSDSDTFLRWATREECERHGIAYVSRPLPGAPPVESPAASPAAYVPKVGDVVRGRDYGIGEFAVVVSVDGDDVRCMFPSPGPHGWIPGGGKVAYYSYICPATAAERVAAGLDAPAVDREGLRIVMESAFYASGASTTTARWFAAADAAIAFLKANGGVA